VKIPEPEAQNYEYLKQIRSHYKFPLDNSILHMSKSRETISYSPYTLGLLAIIGLGLIGYLYFLNLSVVHVVIRKEVMQELQDTKNEIALLETEYISAQHKIAANMAAMSEFQTDQAKVFVMRDASANLVLGQ